LFHLLPGRFFSGLRIFEYRLSKQPGKGKENITMTKIESSFEKFQTVANRYFNLLSIYEAGYLSSIWGISPPKGPKIFTYNLKSPTTNTEGREIRITLFDYKFAHRHLLWHSLYKGINILEWWILSQQITNLEKRNDSLEVGACLVGVLSLCSKTRKGLEFLTSRLKPIHQSLRNRKYSYMIDDQYKESSLLEYVHNVLGVPQKGVNRADIYNLQERDIPIIRPPAVQFVGVGYKDKGSIPQDRGSANVEHRPQLQTIFIVEKFIKRWNEIFEDSLPI
jgi:hypothetical protein